MMSRDYSSDTFGFCFTVMPPEAAAGFFLPRAL
jgi:hypothetical protein